MSRPGLITLPSQLSVKETIDRLEAVVREKGLTVFARIDHGFGAVQAGLVLRPTELLVFGDAKAGTPLMQAAQTIGIDLPLKALAWEDDAGQVWLSANDPAWLADRHGIDAAAVPAVAALAAGLKRFTDMAASA